MEDKPAGDEAPIHDPHHISLQKIAVFLILALILTAGIAFAVKNLIKTEVTPSEIISRSKIPTLTPISSVTVEPTVPSSVADITNWKTYTSMEYYYSLKYPQFLSSKKAGGKSMLFKDMRSPTGLESNSLEVEIDILDNLSQLDAKNFVDKVLNEENISSRNEIIKRSSFNVDGINSEKVIGLPSQSGAVEVYIPREKKMYHVWMQPYDAVNPSQTQKEYAIIFDQILSTFKFTNQTENKSCSQDSDCPEKTSCKNTICVDVGCVKEGNYTATAAVSPEGFESLKHEATECCSGLIALTPFSKYDESCSLKQLVGVSGGGNLHKMW